MQLPTLPGLMRDAIRKAWLFEPVAYLDRALTSSDVTALVASAVMGLPALYLGARLTDPAIFGLSPTQLLLGLPLGVLVGAALMGSTAWMSAYLGVPGVRLLRPALGGLASWPVGLLRLFLQAGWAALVLRLAGFWAVQAASKIRLRGSVEVWMAVAAVLGTLLAVVGPVLMSRWWVKRFSFWASLGLLIWLLWSTLNSTDLATVLEVTTEGRFWMGVDAVVGLALIYWAITSEQTRFASDEGSALSGAALGFAIPALTYTLVGALLLQEISAPGDAGVTLSLPASLAGVLAFAWLLAAEVDGIGALIFGSATSVTPISRFIPGPAVAVVVGASVLSLAILGDPSGLLSTLELAVAVLAPVVAVMLVDFFFIRNRDYSIDDLYSFAGHYSPVNPLGLSAVLVGIVISLSARPVGPAVLVEAVTRVFPRPLGEVIGIPPMLISMLVAGGAYFGLGRWRIGGREYVSALRGI